MTKGRRDKVLVGGATAIGRAVHRLGRGRPVIIAVLGLALGAIVGSLFKLTPQERQMLGKSNGKLKRETAELKNGVSARALDASGDTQIIPEAVATEGSVRTVDESPLVISDAAR